jgi:hypothetical protein
MKKLLSVLLFSVFCITGMFALDFSELKGKWLDSNWDANWVFGIGTLKLEDGKTGEKIFDFTKYIFSNGKIESTENKDGITLIFSCPETERTYKFTKLVNLDTSITMEIDPEWTDKNYSVDLKLK